MPPHRELNPRFQAHFARARRVRVVSVGLLVTCLLVGTGSALAMLAPQGNGAQAAIKNSLASVADTFDSVGSAFSRAANSITSGLAASRTQVAAVSSDDSISNRIYRFFCPWFSDCEEPAVEFTTTTTPTAPVQPRPIQPTYTIPTTTPPITSTQRTVNTGTETTQPIQQTVVNNPVVERVVERVVQGAPASLAGYVTQADLMAQIAAVKSSFGTQLYGDWYNNPGSSSNNGGIVGTIGMMGRIDNLSGTNLSDITVDGVTGLTDADIPDGITASNYLLLTGGAITGDLSLSGTLTAGSLAVAGVSSGGAIQAPYFTATSTSASSTFPNLNATNATTTNATSTNMFSTLGRFTTAIADVFSAVSATITNLTSTTLVATNATTTRLDAFDYVAVGRTATTTIRGDGLASTIPFASSTAVSVSGTGFFGTASTTNFNLSGTANLQSLAADSLLYNNSSRQLAAASVGSSLSFTGSSLSLNLGNGNTWTGLQQFYGAASSTLFSANWAKFGATASSTFGTDGSLTMGGNIILNGKYLSGDGGNEGIYVDTSGNVGIGTTSPFALLSVAGNGYFNGNLTSANLTATGTLTATGLTTLGNASTTQLSVSNTAYFPGSGIWNSSGNVGIGTASPDVKLQVSGGQIKLDYQTALSARNFANTANISLISLVGNPGAINIGDNATEGGIIANFKNGNTFALKNVQSGRAFDIYEFTNDIWNFRTNEASDIAFSPNFTTAMTIKNGGNVGIGETAPGSKLSVSGGATIGASYDTTAAPTNGLLIEGNVGIGTASPKATLQIGSLSDPNSMPASTALWITGDQSLRFASAGGNANYGAYVKADALGAGSSGRLILGTRTFLVDTDVFTINGSNVGIGTTSPWRTFSVSGTAALNGLTAGAGAGSLCLTAGKEIVYSDNAGCTGSSQRFKHDINDLDTLSGIEEVLKLRPVSFVYNDDIGVQGTQVGFIAEEVQKIDPRLTTLDASGTPTNVKYTNMVAIAIKAIQDIWVKITAIEEAIAGFALKITTKELVAVNGDFKTLTTETLCARKSDGTSVCVTGDQLSAILSGSVLGASVETPAPEPQATSSPPVIEQEKEVPEEIPAEEESPPVAEEIPAENEEAESDAAEAPPQENAPEPTPEISSASENSPPVEAPVSE